MARELCLILYLLFFSVCSCDQGKIFLRSDRKKLINAVPIETVPFKTFEECFGICQHNDRCKSFNVYHKECHIFDKDRCMSGVVLADDPDSVYFDLVVGNKCKPNIQLQSQATQKNQSK